MKTYNEIIKANYIHIINSYLKDNLFRLEGKIFFAEEKKGMTFVATNGDNWDHVSVSYQKRCPTWEEMCRVKNLFFYENEWAVQFHPSKEAYVDLHKYCLHIWKPQNKEIPIPSIKNL